MRTSRYYIHHLGPKLSRYNFFQPQSTAFSNLLNTVFSNISTMIKKLVNFFQLLFLISRMPRNQSSDHNSLNKNAQRGCYFPRVTAWPCAKIGSQKLIWKLLENSSRTLPKHASQLRLVFCTGLPKHIQFLFPNRKGEIDFSERFFISE